jgi:ATP-binding protein involved in chromosome partitioning
VLDRAIVPPVAHGVRCISMGFFYDEDKAVAWRGPMLHKALEQFLVDVHWGTLDFLVVDMPPGTGDVPLSVGQQLPRAEVYVVTTPQIGATRVAQRAGALAKQLRHPVRGVIENMSWFIDPHGGRHEIFGAGGGTFLAEALSVPLLAQIPLVPASGGSDDSVPDAVVDSTGEISTAFRALAEAIVELGPARVYRSELSIS